MRIERHSSIAEIPAEDWDPLAKDRPLAGRGWLLVNEQTAAPTRERLYLIGRDDEGPAAAIAAEIHESDRSRRSLDAGLFGGAARLARALGVSAAPAVQVSAWLARDDGSSERRRALAVAALEELERIAGERGWTIAFRRLTAGDFGDVLAERGYVRTLDAPLARLDIANDWRSFADYRSALRRTHPKTAGNMAREINKGVRHGLRMAPLRGAACGEPAWHALLDSHFRRRNGVPFPYDVGLMERLDAELGERALLLAGWIGDQPAGISLGVRSGSVAHMVFIGVDHAIGREASILFNLSYNRPIEHWIEAQVRQINYGTLLYETKVRRGCHIVPAFVYLRGGSAFRKVLLSSLGPVHRLRMQQKHRFALDHAGGLL